MAEKSIGVDNSSCGPIFGPALIIFPFLFLKFISILSGFLPIKVFISIGILDWSVVHNGEISSYGTNKRFVNNFGYLCTFSTDTEVISYLFDLLVRRHKIDIRIVNLILSAPLWEEIEIMPESIKELLRSFRIIYSNALLNGPFSIIVGNKNYMFALNDRIKLRPLIAARKNSFLYVSSEEAPIRKVCPNPDVLWFPNGGEPVIGMLKNAAVNEPDSSLYGLENIEPFIKKNKKDSRILKN